MNPVFANIVGVVGSVLVLGAYAYNVFVKRPDALIYNVVNLLGAVCLTISLMVFFNLASFLLEIIWGTIALLGIVKSLKRRKMRP